MINVEGAFLWMDYNACCVFVVIIYSGGGEDIHEDEQMVDVRI